MIKLSVNVNKFATLRNARGGNNPDVIKAAIDCQQYGAEGITVHPRPDERHITEKDVYGIAKVIHTEYNIEGYPDPRFLKIVKEIKPTQATLVPDPPGVLTSNAGWDISKNIAFLKDVIAQLKEMNIRSSLFVSTDLKSIDGARDVDADRVELYTEPYAQMYPDDKEKAVHPFVMAAKHAHSIELGLNAGHDLDLQNLEYFGLKVPHLEEVSIGHALICDALYFGLENTIQMYLRQLK